MSKKNEVVKKEHNEVEVVDFSMYDQGAGSGVDQVDSDSMITPRLILAQPTSSFGGELPHVKAGDIVDRTENEVVGGVELIVEIIPLTIKTYTKAIQVGTSITKMIDYDHTKQYPMGEFDFTDKFDGSVVKVTYKKCHGLLCLLKRDSDEGFFNPYMIEFKSTAGYGCRQISSEIQRNAKRNPPLPPFTHVWGLKSTFVSEPGKSYYKWDVSKREPCKWDKDQVAELYKTVETLRELTQVDFEDAKRRNSEDMAEARGPQSGSPKDVTSSIGRNNTQEGVNINEEIQF